MKQREAVTRLRVVPARAVILHLLRGRTEDGEFTLPRPIRAAAERDNLGLAQRPMPQRRVIHQPAKAGLQTAIGQLGRAEEPRRRGRARGADGELFIQQHAIEPKLQLRTGAPHHHVMPGAGRWVPSGT